MDDNDVLSLSDIHESHQSRRLPKEAKDFGGGDGAETSANSNGM